MKVYFSANLSFDVGVERPARFGAGAQTTPLLQRVANGIQKRSRTFAEWFEQQPRPEHDGRLPGEASK